MREYELVYLIADSVAEDKQAAVLEKVQKFITDLGGGKIKEENLGRRRLAYEINKNEFATYIQLNFELEGSKIRELERDLKLTSTVIRHLLILKKAAHESILEEKIEAVANEDLEEVIGERSVEQVEGETEESYDLMAKREKEEEAEDDAKEKILRQAQDDNIKQDDTNNTPEEEAAETTEERVAAETSQEEAEAKEEKVEKAEKKPAKKASTKKKTEKEVEILKQVQDDNITTQDDSIEQEEPVTTKKTEKKPAKKASTKKKTEKAEKPEDEAERLKQLDEKLDEILGDDL